MKRRAWMISLAAAVVTAGLAMGMFAADKSAGDPKGKECSMTGMLVCAFCSMADPEHGCSKECCKKCSDSGSPVVLKDDKGQMFLCVSGEKEKKFLTPEVMKMMGGKVKVEGMMVKSGGLQGIYVKKIVEIAS